MNNLLQEFGLSFFPLSLSQGSVPLLGFSCASPLLGMIHWMILMNNPEVMAQFGQFAGTISTGNASLG